MCFISSLGYSYSHSAVFSVVSLSTATLNRADARDLQPSFMAPRKWIRGLGSIQDDGLILLEANVQTFLDTYCKN